MKKLTVLLILILTVVSCTAGRDYQQAVRAMFSRDLIATGKDYRRVLDSWIGYDMSLLIRRWGKPTDSFRARSGNNIYVFNRTEQHSEPTKAYKHVVKALPDGTYTTTFKSKYGFSALPEYMSLTRNGPSGQEVLDFSCETMFEVNQEEQITHWSYRGYDCY